MYAACYCMLFKWCIYHNFPKIGLHFEIKAHPLLGVPKTLKTTPTNLYGRYVKKKSSNVSQYMHTVFACKY